eukprot:GHVU01064643.1.p1 GENE.GHVU01064643.1~~GHVU01064643.1.p1  ORF type:complete len:223 (+),score=13.01 GHVU01064643.1:84-752(+)
MHMHMLDVHPPGLFGGCACSGCVDPVCLRGRARLCVRRCVCARVCVRVCVRVCACVHTHTCPLIEFFKFQKIPNSVAVHFTNAGFDTLESLCTLTRESIDDIESFNKTKWLPGHQIRLKQMFSDIAGRIRAFRQEREKLMQIARLTSGHCDHPAIMTRTNLPPNHHIPALSYGPNPLPRVRPLPMGPQTTSITPPNFQTVTFTSSAANSGAGMPMVHTGSAM